jgi:hypothetical protein
MVWEEEDERFVLIRQQVDMMLLDSEPERSTTEAVVVVDNVSSSIRSAEHHMHVADDAFGSMAIFIIECSVALH